MVNDWMMATREGFAAMVDETANDLDAMDVAS